MPRAASANYLTDRSPRPNDPVMIGFGPAPLQLQFACSQSIEFDVEHDPVLRVGVLLDQAHHLKEGIFLVDLRQLRPTSAFESGVEIFGAKGLAAGLRHHALKAEHDFAEILERPPSDPLLAAVIEECFEISRLLRPVSSQPREKHDAEIGQSLPFHCDPLPDRADP